MRRRAVTLAALGGTVLLLAATGALVTRLSRDDRSAARGADGSPPAGVPAAAGTAAPGRFATIASVDGASIRSVELIRASGTIELVQEQGAWEMTRPARLAVRPGPVHDILYSLANLASERVIEEEPADLAPYGLDFPSVTVRVTLATGEVTEIRLGDMTPAGDSFYLMAAGDPRVYTVREHHGLYFSYGVQELWAGGRSPIDASYIVALRIRKEGRTVLEIASTPELQRSDVEFRGTTLSIVEPWASAPKPVDLTHLTAFVTAFAGLRGEFAVDANPEDAGRYGLDNPSYELLIRDGHGGVLHVFAGLQENGFVFLQFAGDPTVYAGDARLLDLLDVDPARLVNRHAAIVSLDKVDALTISAPGLVRVLEVRRARPGSEEGAEWLVDGRPVDVRAFKNFYTFAVSLQVDSFLDAEVTGAAAVTMAYSLNTGEVSEYRVEFIPYSREFYAVLKNGQGDILVNRQQVAVLIEKLEELAASAGS